jgi:hypothetical protein
MMTFTGTAHYVFILTILLDPERLVMCASYGKVVFVRTRVSSKYWTKKSSTRHLLPQTLHNCNRSRTREIMSKQELKIAVYVP